MSGVGFLVWLHGPRGPRPQWWAERPAGDPRVLGSAAIERRDAGRPLALLARIHPPPAAPARGK